MIVYLARNTVNGKLYVGKTGREFEVRKREHEYDARNKGKTAFSHAIRKYGFDAFEFTLLETCTPETLDDRERYWIKHHNSRKPNGYNLTDGGDGTLGTKRPDVTARLKAMTGERNHQFGKKHSPEMIEVYRQKSSGKNNARFGVVLSKEFRQELSRRTKEAMMNPAVRERYLAALEANREVRQSKKAITALKNDIRRTIKCIETKKRVEIRRTFMSHWDVLYRLIARDVARESYRRSFNKPVVRARRAELSRGKKMPDSTRTAIFAGREAYWKRKREEIARDF